MHLCGKGAISNQYIIIIILSKIVNIYQIVTNLTKFIIELYSHDCLLTTK